MKETDTQTIDIAAGMQALIKRIEKLEKENKKLKQKLKKQKKVKAEAFTLVDKSGQKRGETTVTPVGTAYQVFYDTQKIPRAAFGVLNDGTPRLMMYDENGAERFKASLLKDGAGGLVLSDREGKCRLKISLEDGHCPRIYFYNTCGEEIRREDLEEEGHTNCPA